MLTFVLIVLCVVCACGWLINRIINLTFAWYLVEKNVPVPDKETFTRGIKFVVSHMVKDLFRR